MLLVLDASIAPRSLLTNYDDVTFARVGAVYSDAVKIHIRYPGLIEDSSLQSGVGVLKVVWREARVGAAESEAGMWKDGPVVQLSEENDWIGVAHLTKLWPAHTYQCKLSNLCAPYTRDSDSLELSSPTCLSELHFPALSLHAASVQDVPGPAPQVRHSVYFCRK